MHILIATGLYPPEIGGPATYTALVEKELPKHGIEVSILPFNGVRRWPSGIRHALFFLKCLTAARGTNIIYSQDPVSVGLPSLLVAKILRKKFAIRVAGDYAWEQSAQRFGVKDGVDEFQNKKYGWRTEFLRKAQRFVVNRADLIITPSEYFQKLVSHWVKNPEKVKTIYNGVELEKKQETRDKGQERLIVSAGRLVPWKGFDVLIEIMKKLPDWKLTIIGDGPERQNLESRIKNLELRERVRLVGVVSRGELLNSLGGASVFILNTSFESFSFQTVEAMHAGVPVIVTNVGSLPEIVENGKEGIVVESNNKEQIIAAIKKIDEDNEFRNKIIENAQKKAQQFSIEKTVDNLTKLLWSLK